MNHELVMLRSYKRMKRLSESLTEETQFRIVKSYTAEMRCDDTQAQFREICKMIQLRDSCVLYCNAVINALAIMDKPLRALITEVYFKRADPKDIALRYRVETRRVYHKLSQARSQFRSKLDYLGYTFEWCARNFAEFGFLDECKKSKSVSHTARRYCNPA